MSLRPADTLGNIAICLLFLYLLPISLSTLDTVTQRKKERKGQRAKAKKKQKGEKMGIKIRQNQVISHSYTERKGTVKTVRERQDVMDDLEVERDIREKN